MYQDYIKFARQNESFVWNTWDLPAKAAFEIVKFVVLKAWDWEDKTDQNINDEYKRLEIMNSED